MNSATEQCPWCGSVISRTKFVEIQTKIREDERKKLESAKAALRKELEEKHLRELEAGKRAAEKQAKEELAKKIAVLTADRNRAAERVKELEAREALIRRQAQEEAKGQLKKELGRQRLVLQQDRDQTVLKVQADFNREREGYQKKIKEMERHLQRKTANELGDGAEIDLYETLREAFPGDHITRIQKGQPGADVLQEVLYKGQVCGQIIIDSKNRQSWQNGFVTKLRADQIAAGADHAILSTTVFPSTKKELCIQDGVIVVSPARVPHIIELLRGAMIRIHSLGLSLNERASKMSKLYKYMTSQEYAQRFTELGQLADDLLELDVKENKEHQGTWKKRGGMLTKLKNVLRDIDTDVNAIIEASEESETVPVATEGLAIRPARRSA